MSKIEKWYDDLSELDKCTAMACVNHYRKWPKGMGSVYYLGMTIDKRQFDWVKRNITG